MIKNQINKLLRNRINKKNRKLLKNDNFSVISSNCYGAILLHDLGVKFNSPFVNLWIKPKDFIKYLSNIDYYSNKNLVFENNDEYNYPVGLLDDIRIYFMHYKSETEAKAKWEERIKRLNYDNLYIIFTAKDGCTYEDLKEFEKLPFKHKVVFTNKEYKDIQSSFYIKGFEKEKCLGDCHKFIGPFSGKRYLDQFDYVGFFNEK